MKRKSKSGHEKRLEKKKNELKEAATASGQTSLLSSFGFTKSSTSSRPKTASPIIDGGSTIDQHSSTAVPVEEEVSKASDSLVDSMKDDKNGNEDTEKNDVIINIDDASDDSPADIGLGLDDNAEISKPDTAWSKIDPTDDRWYKGKKLDLNWLLLAESCLELSRESQKGQQRRRPVVTCLLCSKYELEVKRYATNGRIPVASGVRVDGKDRLRSLVDHLLSSVHNEALRLKNLEEAWSLSSDSHPWVKVMKQCKTQTLEFLLRMAVDVYNDCRVETLSARSWPSRSLATEHSNALLHNFETEGWDADFVPFSQPSSVYHYRDPVTYTAMRDIVAKQEIKKTADVLKDCLCFSVQIDGSADKQQVDSKFITARLVPTNEVSVKTVFLGIASSDLGGAEGLLDSFISCLKSVGVETEKLVGVTTDGEKANTGKNAGLWTLLKQHIGRDILTAWCVCHRSDLALESVQSEVPELHNWMADVLALSTFFRSSPRRTKLLHKEHDKLLAFPKHFEVRFAEHTLNLLKAILNNLEAARMLWTKMTDGTINSDRKESSSAKGFLRKWGNGTQQVWLTTVMHDLCKIFKNLQKIFQKSDLILLDVLTARDAAIVNLNVMKEMPVPGGQEEKYLKNLNSSEECSAERNIRKTSQAHRFVTAHRREDGPIRVEIVQSAINFLDQRMNIEEDQTINNLKKIMDASSPAQIINASRDLVSQMFGEDKVEEFVSDVCMSWTSLSEIQVYGQIEDAGTFYALKLRKMTEASCGMLRKFLASFLTLTPHSMATERAVSHYNNIKTSSRASLKPESINSYMHVSLNGTGTAYFDPRPAVFEFLKTKDRRNREPTAEIYREREFIKKFFLSDSGCL